MTRAFVAVSPPAEVLDAIAARVASLAVPDSRVTAREQWHLTVQFLGNTVDIDKVASALAGLDVSGGEVQLGGAGAFPRAKRGQILWLGVVNGASVLTRIASTVASRLAPLGYEPDARPYHPHVTVARYKRPADLRAAVAALGDAPVGPAWTITKVVVYESELRHDRARYTPRATIPLRS